MLILYLVTLLSLFIHYNSISVESFGFLYMRPWCLQRSFYFFLFNLHTVFFFLFVYCLTARSGTSSTMLNRRGESGHPCY